MKLLVIGINQQVLDGNNGDNQRDRHPRVAIQDPLVEQAVVLVIDCRFVTDRERCQYPQ